MCPVCGLPEELCICEEVAKEQQRITVKVNRRRYGKEVTIVEGLDPNEIDVVVHPQSIIHSMVEFIDGAVIAQLSNPDMAIPIALSLFYPERCRDTQTPPLDFNTLKSLDFKPFFGR